VNAPTTSTTSVTVCPSALPYLWNTVSYNAAGAYTATLVNSVGCDSVATLNLAINAPTTSTTSVTVCPSALPYVWNTVSYNAAGTYTATLVNSVGCDSVATLVLTVNVPTASTTSVTICPSALPYTFNGTPYNASGTYTVILTNAAGCDSVATLNLTVNAASASTTNVTVCSSALPYSWNGTPYNAAGTYTAMFTNSVGCDSIATLNLAVTTPATSTTTVTVCPASLPYTWNGTQYNAAGNYTGPTFASAAGCDSIPKLVLVVSGGVIPAFTPLAAICNGSVSQTLPTTSINNITGTWNPATINNTATATYTFTPTAGQCATPITVTQTVTQLQTPTFDALSAICYGTPASSLPGISNEGVTGTWSPAIINNTRTETYTFTPTPGLCQTKATLVQAITALPTASIDNPNPIVMYVGANDGQVVLPGHASGGTIAWTINEGGINSAPISIIEQPTVTPGVPTGSDADPLTVTTNYVLTVTSSAGCQATANINVQVIQKLVIPNIFSPNGDGINETFDIAHIHEFPNVDVSIFNRYGQFIFKSHGYNVPWDGNYEGQPLPVGTYFYIIKTTPDAKPISGPISIVR
jgi:gliding motility-associated-like protein